jgi:glycosyltransferase involved in cell wall biosynthesis
MKLLISSAYYAPHISGLTNSIKNLAELLAVNKYEVTVLTTQHTKQLSLQENVHGVLVQRVPYLVRISKGFIMLTYLFTAYREIRRADQVLINLPQVEGIFVALLAKMLGKKVHSIYVCDVTINGGPIVKIVEYTLRSINKLCLSLSDSVITLTEDFAASQALLKSSTKKLYIIPPVIHEPKILESVQKSLFKKVPRKDAALIGFLGRISSEKGIEYLLDAIPLLQRNLHKDFFIVFAGPQHVVGEKAYQNKIRKQLEKYSNNIFMIGELKDNELGAFYSILDVLVLPSINSTEVFGMVQVEAMLCGTPAVASDLPGVRTVIRQTGMGEVAKRANAKDLAKKLTEVITYRKSYLKRRKEVKEAYSSEKILTRYNELFGQ